MRIGPSGRYSLIILSKVTIAELRRRADQELGDVRPLRSC
jgi:hypothetical protein